MHMRRFHIRRPWTRSFHLRKGRGLWISGAAGVLLAAGLIAALDLQLRPILKTIAISRVTNVVTAEINEAVIHGLADAGITYQDLITVERTESGQVSALSSNMAELNKLRSRLLSTALDAVNSLRAEELAIPIGNLSGISLLSGKGFHLSADAVSAGTGYAEFSDSFTTAGINQTRHQILLTIGVTVDILLPGDILQTEIRTQLPVAETIIVGQVPHTYLQIEL